MEAAEIIILDLRCKDDFHSVREKFHRPAGPEPDVTFPTSLTDLFQKRKFLAFCLFLLMFRLATVVFMTPGLGPDEAQYWRWSTDFDWGYYSKPPLIAWTIGLTTGIFGDAEWAVRFAVPFYHTATGYLIFLATRHFWSGTAGVFAGLVYLLMPGVWLSSTIVSTDVMLLTCWAGALYCLLRLRDNAHLGFAIGLGVSIGLGFLSKYAMVYFPIGMVLAMLYDRPLRRALFTANGLIVLGVAALVLLPHILWSFQTGFKTVGHTADNANWGGDLLNPENGFKFFFDQFGVFGPASFGLLIAFAISFISRRTGLISDARIRLLLPFIFPALLIILVQAFISRAHANWAVSAYPAAAVIIGVWAANADKLVRPTLVGGLALNTLVGALFSFVILAPEPVASDLGAANALKRLRAWPETTQAVKEVAEELNASAIIVDEREIWHGLDYYGRDGELGLPVRAWRRSPHPASYSEETPLSESDAQNALVLSFRDGDQPYLLGDFAVARPVGEITIPLGGKRVRHFDLYLVTGYAPDFTNRRE